MCRAVKCRVRWIVDVGSQLAPSIKKEIVLDAVRRSAQMKSTFAQGLSEFAVNIAARPHFRRGPVGQPAVVHCEAIMVFEYRNHIFGARSFKKLGPLDGIEMRGRETRDKILITELRQRTISSDLVSVLFRAFLIHQARIPLGPKSWNGVDTPVNENPKFSVLVPLRSFVVAQRFPLWKKRARRCGVFH